MDKSRCNDAAQCFSSPRTRRENSLTRQSADNFLVLLLLYFDFTVVFYDWQEKINSQSEMHNLA